MKVRTRFAPSPTGFLHIGNLRSALYSYALAKHDKGEFILRIEDTDQDRKVEGATDSLIGTLKKFGISWDEGPDIGGIHTPYVQSERLGLYKTAAEKLIQEGRAFYCQCQAKNAKEDGYSEILRDSCRNKGYKSGAVKLMVPENMKISYHDFVHDRIIKWDSNTVYDATLLKSDGYPTYHLAVVVDDTDMAITHVMRGHDWLPSTPIHLLVYKFLNLTPPAIGHLTDILSAETGKKLSKRHDSVFVEDFLTEGYLPEALLNFIMLLGWAPKNDRELFTLEEFVEHFSVDGLQVANPKFIKAKLNWFNQQYIQKKSKKEFVSYVNKASVFRNEKQFNEIATGTATFMQSRTSTISEYDNYLKPAFDYEPASIELYKEGYKEHILSAIRVLEGIETWELETVNQKLMNEIQNKGYKVGDFFMSLRIAFTGMKHTPPISEFIVVLSKEDLLGKAEILRRLKAVVN